MIYFSFDLKQPSDTPSMRRGVLLELAGCNRRDTCNERRGREGRPWRSARRKRRAGWGEGVRGAMRKLSVRFGAIILMSSAALMAGGAPVHARRSTASIFQMLDTNKDGTVNKAESRQAASVLFDRLNTTETALLM